MKTEWPCPWDLMTKSTPKSNRTNSKMKNALFSEIMIYNTRAYASIQHNYHLFPRTIVMHPWQLCGSKNDKSFNTFAKTKSSDKKSGISGTFSFLHRYYFSI
jgi:hypothetical protein